jgi:S1-C subfamily serine protease
MLGACTITAAPDAAATLVPASGEVNGEVTQVRVDNAAAGQEVALPAALTTAAQETPAESLESALVNLYEQANPSVVFVIVAPIGSGSGFVYDTDGHILTNNHVVANVGGAGIEVVFASGERARATVVARDEASDLAVLKVDDLPAGVEPLELADPDSIQVGQLVIAIGNPFGEQGSMSLGIVSGLGRSLVSSSTATGTGYSLPDVIQTDAPVNPGNSGGPLLNLDGEVVGINAAINSTTGVNSGVAFAVPVRAVRQIVPTLIAEGEYHYPYLGATFASELSLAEQTEYGLAQNEGAYLVGVAPGGPADDAGLIAANRTTGRGGDLIIAVDGQSVADFTDLNSYLVFHTKVGQTVELTLLRNGETVEVPLTLGERP